MKNPRFPPPDRTDEILCKYLDYDFKVFPLADRSVSVSEINAVADRFAVKFPSEFVGHVCGTFPGVYVEVKEELWPRPKPYDSGPFWSFLYGLHTFTPSLESMNWMRLDHAAEEFKSSSGHNAVPILRIIGDADIYCIEPSGYTSRYNHETNEMVPESIGFWELFEREIRELKDRKVQKTTRV